MQGLQIKLCQETHFHIRINSKRKSYIGYEWHHRTTVIDITVLNCEIIIHNLANIIEKKYHSQVSTYEKEIENKVHDVPIDYPFSY